jgi:hypothetical protein
MFDGETKRKIDNSRGILVGRIPDEKTKIHAQINTTDKQIDDLVYDLYGLTKEEIKIVEQNI